MNKNYLKNSEALKPVFEKAETICHDILEAQDDAKAIAGNIGELANNLFMQCREISKNEGLKPTEIFNNLQFMLGYSYKADKTGAPDLDGKTYKTEQGSWPRGTLSTYRATMLAAEKRLNKNLHDFPTYEALKQAAAAPKKESPFDEVKALLKEADSKLQDSQKEMLAAAMMKAAQAELNKMAKASKASEAKPTAKPKSNAKPAAKKAA